MRRRHAALMPFAALATSLPGRTRAQCGTAATWPTRPIRLVTSFGAGTSGDLIPRLLAQPLAAALDQPVVVENRPGAGGTLGADVVAKAAPDGYTLGFSNIQVHAVAPAVYANVPYDPVRDFTHIAIVSEVPLALAVSAQGPVQDLAQFVALARRSPGGQRVGTVGNGSAGHVSLVVLGRVAGIEITHVPYRGSSVPAVTDVIGGRIEAAMPSLADVGRNDRLRVLAIAAPKRLAGWPAVPTFGEAGYPDMVVSIWFGLSGPAGLPDAIADRLHREVQTALARPEIAARLAELGSSPSRGLSRAEYNAFVAREGERWGEAARAGGIRAE
jgi:tripartite-type tricarboxylate transporter receptor subunit TctC